jgi:hypothetical protein
MTNYNKTCIQIRNDIISKQQKPNKQDKHHVGIYTIIIGKISVEIICKIYKQGCLKTTKNRQMK